jgi:hypothetical protein
MIVKKLKHHIKTEHVVCQRRMGTTRWTPWRPAYAGKGLHTASSSAGAATAEMMGLFFAKPLKLLLTGPPVFPENRRKPNDKSQDFGSPRPSGVFFIFSGELCKSNSIPFSRSWQAAFC